MAKQTSSVAVQPELPTDYDSGLLERVAWDRYKDLTSRTMAGYNADEVAAQAYAEAVPFVAETMRIRSGQPIAKRRKALGPILVTIHIWDPVTGQPIFDEQSGKPVTREEWGDPHGHCPRQDPRHPSNQRYWRALIAHGLEVPERYKKAVAADPLLN